MLTASDAERGRLCRLLCDFGIRALEFKPRDLVFHNISASCDVDRERLSVLDAILRGECDALVTTPSAAVAFTVPRETFANCAVALRVGAEFPPEELTERLATLGFSRTDMVESAGQFSRRGDIVDIWASASELPIRVEFFGDEIDRIAYFDAQPLVLSITPPLLTAMPQLCWPRCCIA